MSFELAMKFVGQWEWGNRRDGGYTNDPHDPGGETKWGISKRAHPDVDIKNLTYEKALEIYRRDYWNPIKCDNLGPRLSIVAFDTAVNCGVGRTKRWLKNVESVEGEKRKVQLLIEQRIIHYQTLVRDNETFLRYIKGWMNRVTDLKKYIDVVTQ